MKAVSLNPHCSFDCLCFDTRAYKQDKASQLWCLVYTSFSQAHPQLGDFITGFLIGGFQPRDSKDSCKLDHRGNMSGRNDLRDFLLACCGMLCVMLLAGLLVYFVYQTYPELELPLLRVTAEVVSASPKIILFHELLSPEECQYFIEKARGKLTRSAVVADKKYSDSRTSSGMWFDRRDPLGRELAKRIATISHIPLENEESFYILHYAVDQQYVSHFDWFSPETAKKHLIRGGQRVKTFLLYLNDDYEGGETFFPKRDISLKPERGTGVLFDDATPNGMLDPYSLHAGRPVVKGEKWLLTCWIREHRRSQKLQVDVDRENKRVSDESYVASRINPIL